LPRFCRMSLPEVSLSRRVGAAGERGVTFFEEK
jgi:hypothetical protein